MKVRTARLHHLHAGSDIGQAMLEWASGADALKNTETAASVSSYTYTRVYLPLKSAGLRLEQCREVCWRSAADILEDDWDCKREHEREDKSTTQSICIESHPGGNMMRDTDLRNYITSLRIHIWRPTGPRPLRKLLCCSVWHLQCLKSAISIIYFRSYRPNLTLSSSNIEGFWDFTHHNNGVASLHTYTCVEYCLNLPSASHSGSVISHSTILMVDNIFFDEILNDVDTKV